MRNAALVAWYTFLEGVRARFFVGAILLGLLFVVLASIIAAVPYGRPDHLIGRIGWGAIFLSGCALSVFYVITTVAREAEQRVVNLILSKPVSRAAYALGKFLGFYALMACMIFIEGAVLTLLVAIFTEHEPPTLMYWLTPSFYIVLKCGSLLTFALLFAVVFTTPILAMLATAAVFFTGIGSADIQQWARVGKQTYLLPIGKLLEWIVPQFSVYDVEGWTVYAIQASMQLHWAMISYFLGYTMLALFFYILAMLFIELK